MYFWEGGAAAPLRAWKNAGLTKGRISAEAAIRILSLQSYNEARSPDGGIGRRARLRTVFRKECRFKSCSGHHFFCLTCAAAELVRIALPLLQLPLHDSVALAGRFFELWSIDNLHVTTAMRDQARFLQHSSRHGHAGATSSQHLGQKFLGQGHRIRSYAVGAHQQPSRQSLVHFMEPVASCNLCYLHCRDLRKLLQPPLQFGALTEDYHQSFAIHAEGRSFNLCYRPSRRRCESQQPMADPRNLPCPPGRLPHSFHLGKRSE